MPILLPMLALHLPHGWRAETEASKHNPNEFCAHTNTEKHWKYSSEITLWTLGEQLIHPKARCCDSHPTSTATGWDTALLGRPHRAPKIRLASSPLETSPLLPTHPRAPSTSSFTPDSPPQPQRCQCPPISRYPWQPVSSPGRRQPSRIESLPSAPASITCSKWAGKQFPQLPQIRMCISASLCSLLSSHHQRTRRGHPHTADVAHLTKMLSAGGPLAPYRN